MTDREQDKRVAEILGWTFWSEQRGEYLLHLIWPPKKDPPYRQSRDWEAQKHRYAQLDANGFKWGNCVNASILPCFTTDPAADYKVLEWVRSTFQLGATRNIHVLDAFTKHFKQARYCRADALGEIHKYEYSLMYQPGDYSHALLALDEQGLLK